MSSTPINPTLTNPWNQLLDGRRISLGGAQRYALTPNCNPITGQPNLGSSQLLKQLLSTPYSAAIAGDNLLIPTLAGRKLIYEIVIWNASAAAINLAFYQGASSGQNLLLPISNFPATTGLTLGFNGSFEMAHFVVDNGQPLVLNLSTVGPVQGMIRYRIQNGTS
jgi:hypothetical protein